MFIDIFFAILFILACLKGYKKGLIVGLISMIAFVIGLAAALKLSTVVATRLHSQTNLSAKWLPVISFMLVFIIVVILVNLCANMLQKTVELVKLGWVNKVGGMIFFILMFSIIFSIFLFFAIQLHLIKNEVISESRCYTFIKPLGPGVIDQMGIIIPFFKDMFSQLEQFFSSIANKI